MHRYVEVVAGRLRLCVGPEDLHEDLPRNGLPVMQEQIFQQRETARSRHVDRQFADGHAKGSKHMDGDRNGRGCLSGIARAAPV